MSVYTLLFNYKIFRRKKISKRGAALTAIFIAVLLVFAALTTFVGCGKNLTVTLDKSTYTLEAGKTFTLKPDYSRDLEKDEVAVWASDKEAVATVNDSGKVTAVAGGKANITVTVGKASATCEVTVTDKYEISLDVTKATIYLSDEDKTVTLNATCKLNGKDANVEVDWSSDNEEVATVSGGTITPVSVGTARITAKYDDKTAVCNVTVTDNKKITLNASSILIDLNSEGVYTLVANCKNNGAAVENAEINWTSSNDEIITVVAGENNSATVTAVATGSATVTASFNGNDVTCVVNVGRYSTVSQQNNAMSADSWYKFGSKGNTQDGQFDNLLQEDKLVITEAARMDLFKVRANPADDSSAYVNVADKTDNFKNTGTAFYNREFVYDLDISASGNFDLIMFGTATLPASFSNAYRGVYLYFTDGKVVLKQSGLGGDTEQATAAYNCKVTEITSIQMLVTRLNDTDILVKIYVNDNKLEFEGTSTVGKLENGNYVENKSVNPSNGYGPRFGVVPATDTTVTISDVTVKGSV